MRRQLALTLVLLVGAAVLAQEGGSPYEAVVKEMIAATDQMTTVLATVKDAASAAEARPPLKKAAEQFVEARKKAEGFRQPDLQEKERLEREYRKKLDRSLTRLREEMNRVRLVAGGPEALEEMAVLDDQKKDETDKDGKK